MEHILCLSIIIILILIIIYLYYKKSNENYTTSYMYGENNSGLCNNPNDCLIKKLSTPINKNPSSVMLEKPAIFKSLNNEYIIGPPNGKISMVDYENFYLNNTDQSRYGTLI